MKKLALSLVVLLHLLIIGSVVLEAANPKRSVSEDTVSESVWDWLTTLGKSPKEKNNIKERRRLTRANKRAERGKGIKENKLQRENEINIREEKRMRQARIRARQKRIEQKRRQINKEKRMLKNKQDSQPNK